IVSIVNVSWDSTRYAEVMRSAFLGLQRDATRPRAAPRFPRPAAHAWLRGPATSSVHQQPSHRFRRLNGDGHAGTDTCRAGKYNPLPWRRPGFVPPTP